MGKEAGCRMDPAAGFISSSLRRQGVHGGRPVCVGSGDVVHVGRDRERARPGGLGIRRRRCDQCPRFVRRWAGATMVLAPAGRGRRSGCGLGPVELVGEVRGGASGRDAPWKEADEGCSLAEEACGDDPLGAGVRRPRPVNARVVFFF